MSDIDTIRERHQGDLYCGYIDPVRGLVDHGFTADCDTRVVLADADRLAEALRELLADPTFAHHQAAKDALRQHSAHTITHTDLPNGTRVIEVADHD